MQTQYLNVQGIAKVTDFAQSFYYLACSNCKRATNAYGDGDFWCNYCAKKVPALTKIKFNIQIADATGSIEAAIFSEVAAEAYGITSADAIDVRKTHSIHTKLLHKLGKPRKCIITLKAYMHSYAGRNQIKFNVHSMSAEDIAELINRSEELLALPPNTPNKKSKTNEPGSTSSTSAPTTKETPNSPGNNN
ncbi:hypothetical protein RHGRI_036667 [Rhododendron griersonianum]|uniref:Replication factor A C-terminal domain-containing protein n=1 Tax=Rhododendron griersonianum TaxID=479676 RepID=A0AAV6HT24_9ERIC|nr:hypothetical protein RHGRI_036667 [Rhododendron griersonianum]